MFNVTSQKLTGNPDASGWTQVYDFKPEDIEKHSRRGHLFALISTSSEDEGLEKVVAGREVLSRLHEEYFGNVEEKPFIALKSAIEKVLDEFSSWQSIEIAAISVVGPFTYLAAGGGSSIYLYRKGGLFKLVESVSAKTLIASGEPKNGDVLLIGTRSFFKTFSLSAIRSALEEGGTSTLIESFAPKLRVQNNEGSVGMAALHFESSVTQEVAPTVINQIKREDKKEVHGEDLPETGTKKAGESFVNIFNPENKSAKERVEKTEFSTSKASKGGLRVLQQFLLPIFKIGKKDVYLKEKGSNESERGKKTSFLVGVLLLAILSVSIYFGIKQKRQADFKKTYEENLVSAEHELQESQSLFLLNPQRSRELFNNARARVLGITSEEIDDPKLAELEEKIKEGEEIILGQFKADPQLFVDLALFSQGFFADDLTSDSATVYILDKKNKKIVEVNLTNKRTQIFAGPSEVGNSNALAAYSDRVFVAAADGLYELDGGRIEIDDGGNNVLIASYAGNLYVLDKGSSMIYRYPATNDGFATKKEWLRGDIEADLSGAKSMRIDGSIWVLTDSSNIYNFSLGNIVRFGFKGIFPEVESLTDIYTDEESEFLYLLEKDKERVVVTTKEGEYEAQYQAGGLSEANKLVVSEKEKKGFVLTSDKVLSFELRHLD